MGGLEDIQRAFMADNVAESMLTSGEKKLLSAFRDRHNVLLGVFGEDYSGDQFDSAFNNALAEFPRAEAVLEKVSRLSDQIRSSGNG